MLTLICNDPYKAIISSLFLLPMTNITKSFYCCIMLVFQRMEAIENFSSSSTNKSNDTYSDTVVVDALPYIDLGYDEPGVREAALALVEEETRRYRPTKNYLEQVSLIHLNYYVVKTDKYYL